MTLADSKAALARRADQANQPAERPQVAELIHQVETLRPQMDRVLPDHIDADQMARAVITVIRKTPDLMKCSTVSVLGAVMTCAQLGLMPGPTGEAWLIPRKGLCEFQLGYQGMVTLFYRHPAAGGLRTAVVFERDEFEHEEGLEPRLIHRPYRGGDPGKPIAYYAVAEIRGGARVWKVLYPWQVEKHRARSSAPNSPAWRDDYDAMAEKTCIRVLFKTLPKNREIGQALVNDGAVRTDTAPDALDTPDWIPGEIVEPNEG